VCVCVCVCARAQEFCRSTQETMVTSNLRAEKYPRMVMWMTYDKSS